MPSTMTNKHGYAGVRKHTGRAWRGKPYYARICIGVDNFKYSRSCATAEEAAFEYLRMKLKHQLQRHGQ